MLYRRFGKTNLRMPVYSCGGMRYQHSWKDDDAKDITAANQDNVEATIRRALELGINHIETARGYGTSEVQLGRILPGLPRESLIVQTKVGPMKTPEEFLNTFDQSMDNLKLDYVDLLGLHGINNPELLDWALRPGGCLEAAHRLKAEGRVRHVGFSTHAPLPIIMKAIESDGFEYVNLHWYYINQTNRLAIEAAAARDMGVFIISPSDKGGLLYKPPQRLVDLCSPLSPMVFNGLFCLQNPQVHTLSLGAAKPSDFDEHMKTLPLVADAEEILLPILERLQAGMLERLGEEWMTTWNIGLPPIEATPGNVNIPVILWLRNLALGYDMIDYGKMRYNLLGNGGHWFPGERASKLNGADLSACLAASPHAKSIPAMLAETDRLLGAAEVKRLSATK